MSKPLRGLDLLVVSTLAALVLLGAAGTSYVRRTGDGQEYMAMALSMSQLDRPALNEHQLQAMEQRLLAIDADFGASIRHGNLVAADGRQDFPHFWMYSAMSAPFVAIGSWLSIHPNWGFTVLNVLLLAGAFAALAWTYSAMVATLFVLGPPLWWVDKAHTEAFTVALLLIGVSMLPRRPWIALPAFGLASTQNIPIAVLVPLAGAFAAWRDRAMLVDPRFLTALGGGLFLAALHPLYYFARLGTYTSQAAMGAVDALVPDPAYLLAPIFDPNIGLVTRFPMMLPIVVLALVVADRRQTSVPWAYVALLTGVAAVWMLVFAQNANLNHGGTPAISRYALWLVPLMLPVVGGLLSAARRPAAIALLAVLVGVSSYVSALEYHPSRPDGYYTPSWLAGWIWTNMPWLDNPPSQIFVERTVPGEVPIQATATPTCSKVLVVNGEWPPACLPMPSLPPECFAGSSGTSGLCYANRSGDGYRFARAP